MLCVHRKLSQIHRTGGFDGYSENNSDKKIEIGTKCRYTLLHLLIDKNVRATVSAPGNRFYTNCELFTSTLLSIAGSCNFWPSFFVTQHRKMGTNICSCPR